MAIVFIIGCLWGGFCAGILVYFWMRNKISSHRLRLDVVARDLRIAVSILHSANVLLDVCAKKKQPLLLENMQSMKMDFGYAKRLLEDIKL